MRKAPEKGLYDVFVSVTISNIEARNSKQYRMTKIQMTKTMSVQFLHCLKTKGSFFCLGHSDIRISDLPFDLAQGGELAEPFRISGYGFRIYYLNFKT